MKTRIAILLLTGLTFNMVFAGDAVYVKQSDGTITKQEVVTLDDLVAQRAVLEEKIQNLLYEIKQRQTQIDELTLEEKALDDAIANTK